MNTSKYISKYLSENGIENIFTVTGGFAMFLNDELNHHHFNVTYHHHEQGATYAAYGYTRFSGKSCVVSTTSGCGATNAITGALAAWQDNLPIIFISGQVKSKDTINNYRKEKNITLKNISGSDVDIIPIVQSITKYAVEIEDKNTIKYHLSKALYEAHNGRKGPVWISIPVDIQGSIINEDDLEPAFNGKIEDILTTDNNSLSTFSQYFSNSKRPIILAGGGIRSAGYEKEFLQFVEKYNIPVVFTFFSFDLFSSEHELYIGRMGINGERAGNFAIQNSDLIISIGCRLSASHVGYNPHWFGREAKIIVVDTDKDEHKKDLVKIDQFLNCDLRFFIDNCKLDKVCSKEWIEKCNHWKKKWLFNIPEVIHDENRRVNPYYTVQKISEINTKPTTYIATAGTMMPITWHTLNMKEGDRYMSNHGGDMGFEIPSSIGVHLADKNRQVVAFSGDGGTHFNIQELQTIVHNNIKVKIIITNNNGYCCIRNTQKNYFNEVFGCDKESGLSLPDYSRIANAYNIEYVRINNIDELVGGLNYVFSCDKTIICEIMSMDEDRYPKLGAKKNDDGTFTGKPFEDMKPFLDRKEFEDEMVVKPI